MGGSSKSTNNTTTNTTTVNESNSAAFNGDMSGHVISGVKNSTITVTDGGAVNAALKAVYDNNKEAFSFGKEALDINEAVSRAAIDKSYGVASQAMTFSDNATKMALDVASNLSLDSDAATARETSKYMMYTAVALAVGFAVAVRK